MRSPLTLYSRGLFLSPAITRHQSLSDAICFTVVVGANMLVMTAHILQGLRPGAGVDGGFHAANKRSPEKVCTCTARKSSPLVPSEMPLLAHELLPDVANDALSTVLHVRYK